METSRILFEFWVQQNYNYIASTLKDQNLFHEDAFHDSLIELWEEIRFADITMEQLSKKFTSIYRKVLFAIFQREKRFICFTETTFEIILQKVSSESVVKQNTSKKFEKIAQTITEYLKTNSDPQLCELFLLHTIRNLSLNALSLYSGIPKSTIHNKVNSLKRDITKRFSLN